MEWRSVSTIRRLPSTSTRQASTGSGLSSTNDDFVSDGPDDQSYMRGRWTDLKHMQDLDKSFELYPHNFRTTTTIPEFNTTYQYLGPGERRPETCVALAGRVNTIRRSGKSLVFLELKGDGAKVQVMCDRKSFTADFDFLLHAGVSADPSNSQSGARGIRRGDLVGVEGYVGRNQRGEVCCFATGLTILAPCVRLLPKEHFGVRDADLRYRHRHLDLLANPESRDAFVRRAAVVRGVRGFLEARGFLEVETPVLSAAACGAAARPFVTRSQVLGSELFLRVAPELYLKRLVVGGIDRVYELGKCFRNEGVDATHNPEFTSVEAYKAYADYQDWMVLTEELLGSLAVAVTGSSRVPCSHMQPPPAHAGEGGRVELELGGAYRRLDFMQSLASATGRTFPAPTELETPESLRFLADVARAHGVRAEVVGGGTGTAGQLLDKLVGALVEPELVQPTFLMHQPLCMSPLAKEHRSIPGLAERFELFVARREIANSYSELNDPRVQRQRFQAQADQRAAGDGEAQEGDESFCVALEYGMPPTAGWGLGVDRLCMLLLDLHSIRQVVLFPALRPIT